jgi:hypothetical protein
MAAAAVIPLIPAVQVLVHLALREEPEVELPHKDLASSVLEVAITMDQAAAVVI